LNYAEDVGECLERKVKAEKLKLVMKEIYTVRIELSKKTGLHASSADIIREDRDHGH
jgi:hypothetical protein